MQVSHEFREKNNKFIKERKKYFWLIMKVKHEESIKKSEKRRKCGKKIKKHISFYVKRREIKNVFLF